MTRKSRIFILWNEFVALSRKKGGFLLSIDTRQNKFFNLNPLLCSNILANEYFLKIRIWRNLGVVLDEVTAKVVHVEPNALGHDLMPSTAFCLLYKLFEIRLTKTQIRFMLAHKNCHVKAIAFLYMRYLLQPSEIWNWFEPYLDNPTQFIPGGDGKNKVSIGSYVENLIIEQRYYSTIFPRIPVPIMRTLKKNILLKEREKRIAKKKSIEIDQIKPGTKVEAQYSEDKKWYLAVVKSFNADSQKYLVQFDSYNNKEEISIDEIRLPQKNDRREKRDESSSRRRSSRRSRSRKRSGSKNRESQRHRSSRKHRRSRSIERRKSSSKSGNKSSSKSGNKSSSKSGNKSRSRRNRDGSNDRSREKSRSGRRRERSRSRHRSREHSEDESSADVPKSKRDIDRELDEFIKRGEKDDASAVGRHYASRPLSYKTQLSVPMQIQTRRQRSFTPPTLPSRRASPVRRMRSDKKKKMKPPSREHLQKMEDLKRIYGDASERKQN